MGEATLRLADDAAFARARLVLETAGMPALFEARETRAEIPEHDLLESLGLVERTPQGWRARVSAGRVEDAWIVADLGETARAAADAVYPATEQTLEYLALLPQSPCERFLDLAAGTGVAGILAASQYARHAWACDLTPRAALFSEFNRRLNGIENLTVGCGDLYQPVTGLTFDRIGAHPPYVPVCDESHIFRDGGEDGEQVLRRIVEGLPDYLEPGGRFYGYVMGADREGEPFEHRLRRWLGPHSADFDVLVIAKTVRTPDSLESPRGGDERRHWDRVFADLRVQRLVFGGIMLGRHEAPRTAYEFRTVAGARSTWREAEWLRGLLAAAQENGAWLLEGCPLVSPHLEMRITHRVREGRLAAEEGVMHVDYPFDMEGRCRPWLADLLAACDGRRAGREHLSACSGISESGFTEILRSLAAGGFVQYREFPLPL